jgi:S-formylglutathione hydrolase
MFFLHHGTEFVHRILFDNGISHEYRLVRGAEHVGPSIAPRFLDAMGFFGRVLNPPTHWTDAPAVQQSRNRVDNFKRRAGYPIKPVDPQRLRTE